MSKNSITLMKEQPEALEELTRSGTAPARQIQHAQVLLKIDSGEEGPNWSDQQVQEAFGASSPTIWRIRQHFLAQGLTRRCPPSPSAAGTTREAQSGRRERGPGDRSDL